MESAMVETLKTILTVTLCSVGMQLSASQECLVLSNGAELSYARFSDRGLMIGDKILQASNVQKVTWPTYSEYMKDLVFAAEVLGRDGIYKLNVQSSDQKSKLLMYGGTPALSPRGDKIAYYNENKKLAIKDVRLGREYLIEDAREYWILWSRPIWLNDNVLVYLNRDNEVFMFHLNENRRSKMINEKIFPLASQGEMVFFINPEATKIFKYEAGELDVVYTSRHLKLGPAIVTLKDGFLFSRQTWPEIIRLSEAKSIFYISYQGEFLNKLADKFVLFGGSQIPCEE